MNKGKPDMETRHFDFQTQTTYHSKNKSANLLRGFDARLRSVFFIILIFISFITFKCFEQISKVVTCSLEYQLTVVTLHAKRGLMDLPGNFFTVTVRELDFSRREFKISRRIHSLVKKFHCRRETSMP